MAKRHRAEQFDIIFGVILTYTEEQGEQGLISAEFAHEWREEISFGTDEAAVETRVRRSFRFLEDRARYEKGISDNWGKFGLQALHDLQQEEDREKPFSRDLAYDLSKFTKDCDFERGLGLLKRAMSIRVRDPIGLSGLSRHEKLLPHDVTRKEPVQTVQVTKQNLWDALTETMG